MFEFTDIEEGYALKLGKPDFCRTLMPAWWKDEKLR